MRKLTVKQKRLIENEAQYKFNNDNKADTFIMAYSLDCYEQLNKINGYENIDADIQREYADVMAGIKVAHINATQPHHQWVL